MNDEIAFLSIEQARTLHRVAIERLTPSERLTVLDYGRFESAVLAVRQTFDGQYIHATVAAMAAGYLFGLAQNHAFENGNKRVAFAACSAFLNMNGYYLRITDDEAESLVLRMVRKEIDRDEVVHELTQFINAIDW